MNFIFISPNFPRTYWNFCDRLHRLGVNVLGIGDEPYESLEPRLRESLTEYCKVDDMRVYPHMYDTVGYLQAKYGHIDALESNNEFWLETDARLRTDFGITSGVQLEGLQSFKSKAEMKKYYALGKVPTARQVKVPVGALTQEVRDFLHLAGYPVIVKPEVGVGAEATYKLSSDEDLAAFETTERSVPYVMEEFVFGDIYSYDAIVDSRGEPLFESSAHFPPSVMDIVNQNLEMVYYTLPQVPPQLQQRGRSTVKAFGVKNRFVHFEFFCLSVAKPGLGEVGDFVGLEVNMRPAGGYTPDMMNYAHSTDVYQIWAEMMVYDRRLLQPSGDDHFCAYYGRRDGKAYRHSHDEVMARYGSVMAMQGRIPEAIAPDLGNVMYMIHARDEAAMQEFYDFISAV